MHLLRSNHTRIVSFDFGSQQIRFVRLTFNRAYPAIMTRDCACPTAEPPAALSNDGTRPPTRPDQPPLKTDRERELTDPERAVPEKRPSPAPPPGDESPPLGRTDQNQAPRPVAHYARCPLGSSTSAALLVVVRILILIPCASYHMPAVVASAFPVNSSPSALPKLGACPRWRSGPCSGRGDRGSTHAGPTSYC
jgi:hypothetical protein